MKKLMIAALATAAVGGAFADPLVYDYKASIKQVNLKEKKVKFANVSWSAYVKYQSSAALKGYLILDADGATSPVIQGLVGSGNSVPATRPADYGRNTAFLVVQNSKAPAAVRFPKILPAVLDAKWVDGTLGGKTGLAEGYLYVGGDVIAGQVRPSIDILNGVKSENGRTPAKGFIGDYCWTSVYLFGEYNGPLFFTGLWDNAEAAIDTAMATTELQQPFTAGTSYFYHDTWMNGSGIGKYATGKATKPCCGMPSTVGKALDTLSGNLKGGIFLCTENGTDLSAGYALIGGLVWEDQYFTARINDGTGTYDGAGDYDQTDLWQDGDLELNTRDIVTGTWSLKFTTKLAPVAVTATELTALTAAGTTEDAKGLAVLMNTIKGAAVKLNKNVIFASGNEIWNEVTAYHDQVTFITPQFCKYYGLLNYK